MNDDQNKQSGSNNLSDESQRLDRNVRDQPSWGPEDTASELKDEALKEDLRERIAGKGNSPENTQSEMLEIEDRQEAKGRDFDGLEANFQNFRSMTREQAEALASEHIKMNEDFIREGAGMSQSSHFLRETIREAAESNAHYKEAFELQDPELAELVVNQRQGGVSEQDVAEYVYSVKRDMELSSQKEDRKAVQFSELQSDEINEAMRMSPEQAQKQLKRDLRDHADLPQGQGEQNAAYYQLNDMQLRAQYNPHYKELLEKSNPEVYAQVMTHRRDDAGVDVESNLRKALREDSVSHAKASISTEPKSRLGSVLEKAIRNVQDATVTHEKEESDSVQLNASRAKDDRKNIEADAMRLEREAVARKLSPEQAQAQAKRDISDHTGFESIGARGDSYAYYLRGDMQERMDNSAHYRAELEKQSPELFQRVALHGQDEKVVNVQENLRNAKSTVEMSQEDAAKARSQNAQSIENDRKRKEFVAQMAEANEFSTTKTGKELDNGDFIVPRRITNAYAEHEGKYVDKETMKVAFEDKGNKLSTASVDKETIANMVALAHAKQWDSLKLQGTQEFRREAWLQAESQGIKTVGYTPKGADLAQLEALRQSRATNLITPLQERKSKEQQATQAAPLREKEGQSNKEQPAARSKLSSDPLQADIAARKNLTANIEALRSTGHFEGRSTEDLTKAAYWRGVMMEENRGQPKALQDGSLQRFDAAMSTPKFLESLPSENQQVSTEKVVERVQVRDSQEMSL